MRQTNGGVEEANTGVWECPQAGWVKCNVDAGVKEAWGSSMGGVP